MNLLEALEKKKALESALEDRLELLSTCLDDQEEISRLMTAIDTLVDEIFGLGRKVDRKYETTFISQTETISDVISYIDGLTKK